MPGTGSVFWHIALPLTRPALVVVALFEFQAAWTDLMRGLIYLRDREDFTVPRGLKSMLDQFGFGGEWHWELDRDRERHHDRADDHRVLHRPEADHPGRRHHRHEGLTSPPRELRPRDRSAPELPRGRSSSGCDGDAATGCIETSWPVTPPGYGPNAQLHAGRGQSRPEQTSSSTTSAWGEADGDLESWVWGVGKAEVLRREGALAYVGDHVHDVEGARAAEVLSVSVLTGGCTRAELEEAGTDVVLDDLSAFPAWLDAAVRDRSA